MNVYLNEQAKERLVKFIVGKDEGGIFQDSDGTWVGYKSNDNNELDIIDDVNKKEAFNFIKKS
jgi:hypothetical protein